MKPEFARPMNPAHALLQTVVAVAAALIVTVLIDTGGGKPLPSVETLLKPARDAAVQRSDRDLSAIPRWHLFGRPAPASQPPRSAIEEKTVSDAITSARIVGIVTAGIAGEARAIIATASREHRTYRVGDAFAGSAVIAAISRRTVTIAYDGRHESLGLPGYLKGAAAAHQRFVNDDGQARLAKPVAVIR